MDRMEGIQAEGILHIGRGGNRGTENSYSQGRPKLLEKNSSIENHEIQGSCDSPWMVFVTLLHSIQKLESTE